MGMLVIIIAGVLAACANLCMRRSIDAGGSARAYLVVQISFSCLVGVFLHPVRTGQFAVAWPAAGLGVLGGLLLGGMLWSMGRALEKGPPGFTFATVNSATVVPALVLVGVLGQSYHMWHAVGSGLVVVGLFWAGWGAEVARHKLIWVVFAGTAFTLHALLLTLLQWRVLVMADNGQWFMPIVLAVAGLFQLPGFFRARHRPTKGELQWGLLGGVVSGGATSLLILAPVLAVGWQQVMLFPAFAVTVILVSNAWGRTLYQERVNWLAAGVCALGIVIGTAIF